MGPVFFIRKARYFKAFLRAVLPEQWKAVLPVVNGLLFFDIALKFI